MYQVPAISPRQLGFIFMTSLGRWGLGAFQLSRPCSLRLLTKISWLGIISKDLEGFAIKPSDREIRIDTVHLTKVIDKHVKA
jgi:hypothetical protein